MRRPGTVLHRDDATGIALHQDWVTEPGGGDVAVYRIGSPIGLPEHLAPADASNRQAWERAYAACVEWAKSRG